MSLIIDPYRFGGDTFLMSYQQTNMTWAALDGSSGVTYTRFQNSTQLGGGGAGQASTADADLDDYIEWFFNLAAGTYTLTVIHSTSTDRAKVTFALDGSSLGTLDWYSAGSVVNVVSTITGIVVAADGNYTLRATASDKNASSSDYFLNNYNVTLHRTGA